MKFGNEGVRMSLPVDALAEQPIGSPVDTVVAGQVGPMTIEGRFCRIEALDPIAHDEGLWQSFQGDNRLWTYLPFGPFADEQGFSEWLDGQAALADPFSYVVIDKAADTTAGIVTLMEIRPAIRVIEIGGIIYARALQRTPAATEAQYLMARYVFEQLAYRRYEWKCDALNAPSRQAALRLGFTFEGIFRQHRIVKGRNRDSAWFSMLDGEWPARERAFERWLSPDNFDENGNQRASLASLNLVI
jgi:RimJ/RimL family protein N-acetyltransferase